MGEIRATTTTPTVPFRYHAGVDVADHCVDTARVFAIEGGRVSTPVTPGCLTSYCRRVTTLDGRHAFEYVDIQSSLADGATVQAGDLIGSIADVAEGPHLHLNEIYGLGLVNCENGENCYRINPQRENAMVFIDTDIPSFAAFDVGSVTNEEIILVGFTGTGPEGGQTPTPFTFMENTFFVKGEVDVLAAVHNVGTEFRKGVYMVDEQPLASGQSCNALNINPGPNIAFNTLFDRSTSTGDILTTFFKQFSNSNGVIATNWQINNNPNQQTQNSSWNTNIFPEGARQICVSATSYPRGTTRSQGQNVVIDRTAPTITFTDTADVPFTYATSSTTIKVVGNETVSASGIYTITLSSSGGSQTSTNTSVTTSYTATFSGLTDGSYTATVVDLAGNSAQASFIIDTSGGGSRSEDSDRNDLNYNLTSTQCLSAVGTSGPGGVAQITITGPGGFSKSGTFDCVTPSTKTVLGPYCNLAVGDYYSTVTLCNGKTATSTTAATTGSGGFNIELGLSKSAYTSLTPTQISTGEFVLRACSNTGNCNACTDSDIYRKVQLSPGNYNFCDTGGQCCSQINPATKTTVGFTVTNTLSCSTCSADFTIYATAMFRDGGTFEVSVATSNYYHVAPLGSVSGTVHVPEVGQRYAAAGGDATSNPPIKNISITKRICQAVEKIIRKVLIPPIDCHDLLGSAVVFSSTSTLSFTYTSGTGGVVATDTTTLAVYQYTGTDWSSATVTNQAVSLDTTTNIVSISGEYSTSGTFVPLFRGHDSTAPITSISYQLTSSSTFAGTVYLSTDAFVVLIATDPPVNGYASGLATTYYRIDPSSSSDAFSVYATSIPLALGPHIFEYKSVDWAGNYEAVKTSTFIVTTGGIFKTSSDVLASGDSLAGFLGVGAKMEAASAAQYNYTLGLSSPNGSPMLNISNIGTIGLGLAPPSANLEINGTSDNGNIGLQLRSGNSTQTVSSAQLAFGYNDPTTSLPSMNHLLRTEHSTSALGNTMDFLVWNPGAGSTSTLANLNALSLQAISGGSGGSFHVHPFGNPTVELEVSNGSTLGGGIIERAVSAQHSSRYLKSDIRYLNHKAQAQAYADVLSLRHASFRYKKFAKDGSLLPVQDSPLRMGLIYEDSPASILGPGPTPTIVIDERLNNAELALKEAIGKIQKLQERLKKLRSER